MNYYNDYLYTLKSLIMKKINSIIIGSGVIGSYLSKILTNKKT